MRRALCIVGCGLALTMAPVVVSGCGSSGGSSSSNEIPPDLVPATAKDATVTVTRGDRTTTVAHDVIAHVVPLLIRRVFDATEPLASYGLEPPAATVTFTLPDGGIVILSIGGQDFDKTAYYVQRSGDSRVWLVLADSINPLLNAA